MNADRLKRIESIFDEIVSAPLNRRDDLLNRHCADDFQLRAFVTRMLDNDSSDMGEFLHRPLIAPDAFNDSLAPPKSVGPYRIISELGRGGMGIVYEAEQGSPKRIVALKLIRKGLVSRKSLRRFQHEAEILAHLQHPGIAQVFDANVTTTGNASDQPYIAMELVRGSQLPDHVSKHNLSIKNRIKLIIQICEAIQHAHQKGVIHRDLKPSNILVGETGPKVVDFGVARAVTDDLEFATMHTQAGDMIGTVAYMSPEQINGQTHDIDVRTDVYSLGIVAYTILTGQHPFDLTGKPLPQATRIITETEPKPAGRIDPRLAGDIEAILAKAIEKDPDRRYASMNEFAADLHHHLNHEPITARRPTKIVQLTKFSKRHRGLVSGLALAFIILIAGTITTATFAWRESEQAENARIQAENAKTQAENARIQAGRANSVAGVLRQMLSSANPANSRGEEMTVRELLDLAASQFDDENTETDPAILAPVNATIGETYYTLGLYDEAAKHLVIARDFYESLESPATEELILVMLTYANVLSSIGDREAALALEEESLELAQKELGDTAKTTVRAMSDMAVTLSELGRWDEAETLHREAIAIRRNQPDTDIRNLAVSLVNLGTHYLTAGRYDEAESLLRESLDIRRSTLHDDHPAMARSLNSLGSVLQKMGKLEEAEQLLTEALAIHRKTLHEDHPDLAAALNNLATLIRTRGKTRESVPLFEEAINILKRTVGEDHPNVGSSYLNLAGSYFKLGERESAQAANDRALTIFRNAFGSRHPNIAAALHNIATGEMKNGNAERAESMLEEALSIAEETIGPQHPNTAHIRTTFGVFLGLVDKHEESVALLENGLDIRRETFGDQHGLVGFSYANLSVVQLDAGDSVAAAESARHAIAVLEPGHFEGEQIAAKLVLAAAAIANQTANAQTGKQIESVLEYYQEDKTQSWFTADALMVQADWFTHIGDHEAAEEARNELATIHLDCENASHVLQCERTLRRLLAASPPPAE